MMIARRLRPLGWAAAVGCAAVSFYLVSLRVAAERGDLESLDRQIVATQNDIRQLRTELRTRASMRQLERWNGDVLALSAPSAAQYLQANQLAQVDTLPGDDKGLLNIPQTVRVAAIEPAVVAPTPAVVAPAAQPTTLAGIVAPAQAATPVRTAALAGAGDVDSKRKQRAQMLNKKLLDDHLLGDLNRTAARENAVAGPAVGAGSPRKLAIASLAEVERRDAKPGARRPEAAKAEARKAEPKKPEVRKVEVKKADVKKAEAKKANERIAAKKPDTKKADVRKAEVKKPAGDRRAAAAGKPGGEAKRLR